MTKVTEDDIHIFLTKVNNISEDTAIDKELILKAYEIKEMERRNNLYEEKLNLG